MTSRDLFKLTFSPGSEGGRSPSSSQDGPPKGKSGPALALASPFRLQASKTAPTTLDTSGPLFTASSPSAILQRFLESKLRARMALGGSRLYVLTWRAKDMPWGPPILRLVVSVRTTSAAGFSGWPTPTTRDSKGANSAEHFERCGPRHLSQLSNAVAHLGPMPTGSTAPTAKPGQLNPAFARWLMGYPAAWDDCAPTATPSCRK